MQSEYLKTLIEENRDVGERYLKKIKLIKDVDPFTINVHDRNSSIQAASPITYMDIAAYLVLTHSFYSKEQMRAYKSLESYKYFEAGFVLDAGTVILNNFHVLIGKAFISNEDSEWMGGNTEPNENVERVRRAFQNDLETIPAFIIIGLFYLWVTVPGWVVHVLYYIFLIVRVLHSFVYAIYVIPQPTRAVLFGIGFGILGYMSFHVLIYSVVKGYLEKIM